MRDAGGSHSLFVAGDGAISCEDFRTGPCRRPVGEHPKVYLFGYLSALVILYRGCGWNRCYEERSFLTPANRLQPSVASSRKIPCQSVPGLLAFPLVDDLGFQ